MIAQNEYLLLQIDEIEATVSEYYKTQKAENKRKQSVAAEETKKEEPVEKKEETPEEPKIDIEAIKSASHEEGR